MRRKFPAINETLLRDIVGDVISTQVDGNAAGNQTIEDLFGNISSLIFHVFVANAKAVIF